MGFGESGRQGSRFLDSHSQAGEEIDQVNGRHAAIADRDDVASASIRQLFENVLRLEIGIVHRTEEVVSG